MSLSETRVEILQTADQLRPLLLESRWAELERMGLPAGKSYGDVVTGTRPLQIPVDKEGELRDALDKRIKAARKAYTDLLEDARKALIQAAAIHAAWMVAIHIATKEEREKASDDVQCLACLFPIVGSPRSGFCKPCSQSWYDAGKPDRVWWIKQRREFLEMDEALEA